MNRNWKDKRNKTSFKFIFCILSTELVYNQERERERGGARIESVSYSEHRFPAPSSKSDTSELRGALYHLRVAVRRRCPAALSERLWCSHQDCGGNTASKHARKYEARPPRVKKIKNKNDLKKFFVFVCLFVLKKS